MAENYVYEEKEDFAGNRVKVLGPTYDSGKPAERDDWTEKLQTGVDRMQYLKTALRYWYSADWFGSEKRKQDA